MYPGLKVTSVSSTHVVVEGRSIISGKLVTLSLPKAGFDLWQSGSLIQDAFPELDADNREFLISGVGPGEFDGLFPEDV